MGLCCIGLSGVCGAFKCGFWQLARLDSDCASAAQGESSQRPGKVASAVVSAPLIFATLGVTGVHALPMALVAFVLVTLAVAAGQSSQAVSKAVDVGSLVPGTDSVPIVACTLGFEEDCSSRLH